RRIVGTSRTATVLSDLGRANVADPDMADFVNTYLPRANTPPTYNTHLALVVRNELPRISEDMGTGRWDYHFRDSDTLFVRYNIHDTHSTAPALGSPRQDGVESARQQIGTVSATHIFSPT